MRKSFYTCFIFQVQVLGAHLLYGTETKLFSIVLTLFYEFLLGSDQNNTSLSFTGFYFLSGMSTVDRRPSVFTIFFTIDNIVCKDHLIIGQKKRLQREALAVLIWMISYNFRENWRRLFNDKMFCDIVGVLQGVHWLWLMLAWGSGDLATKLILC